MSSLEVFVERPNGDVEQVTSISNSFQGAFYIWVKMATRYGLLPPADSRDYTSALGRAMSGAATGTGAIHDLWAMTSEIYSISPRDAYVLGMTFDRVLVARDELHTLAQYLAEWLEDYGPTPTLVRLVDVLKRIARDDASRCLAVGFNHTSVSSPFWLVYGKENEDGETECRAYNTHTDTGHWYLSPATLRAQEEEVEA